MRGPEIIGRLIGWLIRRTFATMRVTIVLPDGRRIDGAEYPYDREIFAFSERDLLSLSGMTVFQPFTTLVARGRDGDIATAAAAWLGCTVVRGATARGGLSAVRALERTLVGNPQPAALVVDGPLGPAGQARPGAVRCASNTGRALRAVAIAATPAVRVPGTWSGLMVPLPFGEAFIAVDDALTLAPRASRNDVNAATARLTERLAAMRTLAASALAQRRQMVNTARRFA
jgi:lysophospholipid acyltransferase (LPLAT)-like uncharacterized protein